VSRFTCRPNRFSPAAAMDSILCWLKVAQHVLLAQQRLHAVVPARWKEMHDRAVGHRSRVKAPRSSGIEIMIPANHCFPYNTCKTARREKRSALSSVTKRKPSPDFSDEGLVDLA